MTPAKTTVCGSGQGRWDSTSVLLPASANNNATVKIGFRWVNNDDGTGTDPSFAVDSVSLRTPAGSGPIAASMTGSGTTVCEDSSLTFTNTSTGTVDSFRFKCPGATIAAPGTSPCTVSFINISGSKVVKLYLYSGGIAVDSASTTVMVNRAPSPLITKTGTTYSVPALYTAYQWYTIGFPPTAITGATNATYTTTVTGSYAIMVDSAGCKGISIYVAPGGFEQLNNTGSNFWIAQTNNSMLSMNASIAPDRKLDMHIYDATGRLALSDVWSTGENQKQISGISLPPGLYIIRLSNENTSIVLRWHRQ